MASALFNLSAILIIVAVRAADVSQQCLGCICLAVSGCRQDLKCEGDVCGVYRITWGYWADADKPTINGQSSDASDAYPNCSNDPNCATLAVQRYLNRYSKDCNGDGKIDCYDSMAIHNRGAGGCGGGLDNNYVHAFNLCLANKLSINVAVALTISL